MRRDLIIKLVRPYVASDTAAKTLVDELIEEGVINAFYGDQEVSEVVEAFKEYFGTTATSRYDRFAARRLVNKHGTENVVNLVKTLAFLQDRQFAPTVNNVSELERKWVSCIKFIRGQKSEELKEL